MDNRFSDAIEAKYAAIAVAPRADMRASLRRSRVFYLSQDVYEVLDAASASVPMAASLHRGDTPCDDAWFWCDVPARLAGHPELFAYHWAYGLLADNRVGFTLAVFAKFGARMELAHEATIGEGVAFEDFHAEWLLSRNLEVAELWGEAHAVMLRFLVAACVWMRQQILVPRREQPERHARKRIQKLGARHDETIDVVLLRKAQRVEPESTTLVDWQCRWVVAGHWRNQYHPTTRSYQLKWIIPYLKGPADKPFKAPSEKVYAVVR